MRMRSPSSAPPLRRRVGSIATTAICRVGKLAHESRQQFVGQARLAGAAGAGDADDRRLVRERGRRRAGSARSIVRSAPRRSSSSVDRARDVRRGPRGVQRPSSYARLGAPAARARTHRRSSRRGRAAAVFGRVDLLDAMALERLDLVAARSSAAAHDHPDVLARRARAACPPCTRSTRCARPGRS